ncbi:TetR/AcrR family transcriptional regulator [Mycolicibacterium sp. S2-37]|uniref:TetR/AcrR family transcriptional regulator n=1 Tax=Mycolicibacterium sp. S2-37 TaxID=2810297 RepID=UPI001A942EF9|nr:TetR/AcrR family transcriptional regulator [Mycolicibacterium sp. S2-37]MBO0675963.1 TetR/AcrR family transcriptional regulator [Mycolicibacterium sp. S2-37]
MGKRQDSRARIEGQIIDVGRRHLVTSGPAGLSLRAIARDLGMVSSAVYRYVASRDDLLTLLLVDAYGELAAHVDRARDTAGGDRRDRLLAIAHAARAWATSQPARWALLYGSPVPGYHAPADRTVIPGTRVVQAIFDTVADGALQPSDAVVPPSLSADLDRLRAEFGFAGPDDLVVRCTALWAGLVGAISLEVFGQYGPDTFSDPAAVFDLQMAMLIDMLGLPG